MSCLSVLGTLGSTSGFPLWKYMLFEISHISSGAPFLILPWKKWATLSNIQPFPKQCPVRGWSQQNLKSLP